MVGLSAHPEDDHPGFSRGSATNQLCALGHISTSQACAFSSTVALDQASWGCQLQEEQSESLWPLVLKVWTSAILDPLLQPW